MLLGESPSVITHAEPADAVDDDLERRIVNFLKERHIPGVRWIEVESSRGVVTLSGLVKTFYQKQLSVHCARRVAGVVQVIDEIKVA